MKTIIKKYLRKNLSGRPKHYQFWRWVASLFHDKESNEHILACIVSYFYHNKKKFPNADFTDIFVVDKDVYIYTRFPGIWIGKGGSTIDKLEESFNRKNDGEPYKIIIIEDNKSSHYHIWLGLHILNEY